MRIHQVQNQRDLADLYMKVQKGGLRIPEDYMPIEQKVQMLLLNLDMDRSLLQAIVTTISMFLRQGLDLEGLSLPCQGWELESLPLPSLG
jgi:hypothetical protein